MGLPPPCVLQRSVSVRASPHPPSGTFLWPATTLPTAGAEPPNACSQGPVAKVSGHHGNKAGPGVRKPGVPILLCKQLRTREDDPSTSLSLGLPAGKIGPVTPTSGAGVVLDEEPRRASQSRKPAVVASRPSRSPGWNNSNFSNLGLGIRTWDDGRQSPPRAVAVGDPWKASSTHGRGTCSASGILLKPYVCGAQRRPYCRGPGGTGCPLHAIYLPSFDFKLAPFCRELLMHQALKPCHNSS